MVPTGTNDDFYFAFSLHLEDTKLTSENLIDFESGYQNSLKLTLYVSRKNDVKLANSSCVAGRLITICFPINILLGNFNEVFQVNLRIC